MTSGLFLGGHGTAEFSFPPLEMPSEWSTCFLQQHMKNKPRAPERHMAKETNVSGLAEGRMFVSREMAVWNKWRCLQPIPLSTGKISSPRTLVSTNIIWYISSWFSVSLYPSNPQINFTLKIMQDASESACLDSALHHSLLLYKQYQGVCKLLSFIPSLSQL